MLTHPSLYYEFLLCDLQWSTFSEETAANPQERLLRSHITELSSWTSQLHPFRRTQGRRLLAKGRTTLIKQRIIFFIVTSIGIINIHMGSIFSHMVFTRNMVSGVSSYSLFPDSSLLWDRCWTGARDSHRFVLSLSHLAEFTKRTADCSTVGDCFKMADRVH